MKINCKHTFQFFGLLTVLLWIGCKKENFITEAQYKETDVAIWKPREGRLVANATKHVPNVGVVPWTASSTFNKYFLTLDSVEVRKNKLAFSTFLKVNENMIFNREVLEIYLPKVKELKQSLRYKIEPYDFDKNQNDFKSLFWRLSADGDVLERGYTIDPYYDNYLVFTKIDTTTKYISGIFSLHYKLLNTFQGNGYNENLFIENGRFEVNYIE